MRETFGGLFWSLENQKQKQGHREPQNQHKLGVVSQLRAFTAPKINKV